MLNLKDRHQVIDNSPAPVPPFATREKAEGATAGAVSAGKRALLKAASGIAWLGNSLSGPPMSERGRFRHAATISKIQTHRAMAANWPQYPSR